MRSVGRAFVVAWSGVAACSSEAQSHPVGSAPLASSDAAFLTQQPRTAPSGAPTASALAPLPVAPATGAAASDSDVEIDKQLAACTAENDDLARAVRASKDPMSVVRMWRSRRRALADKCRIIHTALRRSSTDPALQSLFNSENEAENAICDLSLQRAWDEAHIVQGFEPCREYGMVAHGHGDCTTSPECDEDGACVASDEGLCLASAASCKASKACTDAGRCSVDLELHYCAATKDSCAESAACKGAGYCNFAPSDGIRPAACVPSAVSCRSSAACRESGACTFAVDRCEPKTDADCQASDGCKKNHRCRVGAFGPIPVCM